MKSTHTHTHSIIDFKAILIACFSFVITFQMSAQTNTLPAAGNVGIGTTTPSALLDVNGNMVVDSSVVIKDSLNVQKKLIVDQDLKIKGESVFVGDGKFKDKLVVDGLTKLNGDLKIKSLENTALTTSRLLSILPNGKVEIANILLPPDDTYTCVTTMPWALMPNSTSDIRLCPNFTSVNIGGDFSVGGTTRLSSTGIGTTANNLYQLNVQSVNKDAGIRLFNLIFNPGVKYGFKNIVTTNDIKAYSVTQNSTQKDVFVVMGDGRVGVGTDNPEDLLQVGELGTKLSIGSAAGQNLGYGTSYIGFNSSRINNTWATSNDGANNGGAVMYGDIFGNILFAAIPTTGSANQSGVTDATLYNNLSLFVGKDGGVGIGTSKVYGFKLSVEGGIRARSVQVDATNIPWYDHVFAADYPLQPLKEVETFINQHQHLPNVPSEKEVRSNGINLAEMDAVLLRKIEELTLYLIDLKNDNEELKIKVKQLEEGK